GAGYRARNRVVLRNRRCNSRTTLAQRVVRLSPSPGNRQAMQRPASGRPHTAGVCSTFVQGGIDMPRSPTPARPPTPDATPAGSAGPGPAELLAVIARHWGFRSLRPLQRQAMQALLDRRDSLVVLPTGGGKSL